MHLKFARRRQIFSRIRGPLPRPFRLAHLPPPSRPCPIQCQAKRDTHEPSPKPRTIPQPLETPIRPQQRLLRHIFRIRRVAQNSARHAKRQRAALRQPLLELAAQLGRHRSFRIGVAGPARSGRTGWLGQSQLPYQLVAEPHSLASLYSYQTPPSRKWFAGDEQIVAASVLLQKWG